ncbi:unnamed protein product, partial [Ectocarpus fasciculatus]
RQGLPQLPLHPRHPLVCVLLLLCNGAGELGHRRLIPGRSVVGRLPRNGIVGSLLLQAEDVVTDGGDGSRALPLANGHGVLLRGDGGGERAPKPAPHAVELPLPPRLPVPLRRLRLPHLFPEGLGDVALEGKPHLRLRGSDAGGDGIIDCGGKQSHETVYVVVLHSRPHAVEEAVESQSHLLEPAVALRVLGVGMVPRPHRVTTAHGP